MEYFRLALESFFIVFAVMIILEFAGRKSVSQFSMIQVVIFIAIGEVVLLPISDPKFTIVNTIVVTITLVLFLIFMEWLEIKFNFVEKLLTRKALIVVQDGKLIIDVLKKQRLSVDQLEIKLRTKGLNNYEEMKTITLEANGEIGYEFKDDYKPLNKIEMLQILGKEFIVPNNSIKGNNHFDEIKKGHSIEHNKDLE